MTAEDYTQAAALVTEECHRALTAIEPEKVLEYLDMLTSAKRVFFVGVGRVLLSLEAIAKRYAHLGKHCIQLLTEKMEVSIFHLQKNCCLGIMVFSASMTEVLVKILSGQSSMI